MTLPVLVPVLVVLPLPVLLPPVPLLVSVLLPVLLLSPVPLVVPLLPVAVLLPLLSLLAPARVVSASLALLAAVSAVGRLSMVLVSVRPQDVLAHLELLVPVLPLTAVVVLLRAALLVTFDVLLLSSVLLGPGLVLSRMLRATLAAALLPAATPALLTHLALLTLLVAPLAVLLVAALLAVVAPHPGDCVRDPVGDTTVLATLVPPATTLLAPVVLLTPTLLVPTVRPVRSIRLVPSALLSVSAGELLRELVSAPTADSALLAVVLRPPVLPLLAGDPAAAGLPGEETPGVPAVATEGAAVQPRLSRRAVDSRSLSALELTFVSVHGGYWGSMAPPGPSRARRLVSNRLAVPPFTATSARLRNRRIRAVRPAIPSLRRTAGPWRTGRAGARGLPLSCPGG
jgi:hypothetical protein